MRNKVKIVLALCLITVFSTISMARALEANIDPEINPIDPPVPTGSETSETTTTRPKLDAVRARVRATRIEAIGRVYQAQINRAQNAIDRLQKIIDRIKVMREKLADASASDMAELDEMIAKAESQKEESITDLQKIKDEADSIQDSLGMIKTDTDRAFDTSASEIANLKNGVKDFQVSVKDLKKDLIALHNTLSDIIRKMREIQKENGDNEL